MDAKPQRPRILESYNDENAPALEHKALHQRYKSTGTLSSIAHTAGAFKSNPKRSVFGDLTGDVRGKGLSKDDSNIAGGLKKNAFGGEGKENQWIPLNEKDKTLPHLLKPAQKYPTSLTSKPINSLGLTSTGTKQPLADNTSASLNSQSRKALVKRSTTVYKDKVLPQGKELPHTSKQFLTSSSTSNTRSDRAPRHFKSQPSLKEQAPSLRKTKSRILSFSPEDQAGIDVAALKTDISELRPLSHLSDVPEVDFESPAQTSQDCQLVTQAQTLEQAVAMPTRTVAAPAGCPPRATAPRAPGQYLRSVQFTDDEESNFWPNEAQNPAAQPHPAGRVRQPAQDPITEVNEVPTVNINRYIRATKSTHEETYQVELDKLSPRAKELVINNRDWRSRIAGDQNLTAQDRTDLVAFDTTINQPEAQSPFEGQSARPQACGPDDLEGDDDGYSTARSVFTEHSATVSLNGDLVSQARDLVTRTDARSVRELATATNYVVATRTIDEIEDEKYDQTLVTEYNEDIFKYMKELERKMGPDRYYMDTQAEIDWSMRAVLMDWLVQVHSRFGYNPETLFLAVNYIDRFLSQKVVSLGKLQLVGATAIFIAAKYEEIFSPSAGDIHFMVDGSYTKDEIFKAERFMLNMLDHQLGWPGPMSFLRRISKADDYDIETRTLAKYFLEVTIMDDEFVATPPSFLAAAAHCLARLMLRKGTWSAAHTHYSGHTYRQLLPTVSAIQTCCMDPRTHHSAIFEKYCDRKYKQAALFVETELRRGFNLDRLDYAHHTVTDRYLYEQTNYPRNRLREIFG